MSRKLSAAHRKRISEGVKRYHANKNRRGSQKDYYKVESKRSSLASINADLRKLYAQIKAERAAGRRTHALERRLDEFKRVKALLLRK